MKHVKNIPARLIRGLIILFLALGTATAQVVRPQVIPSRDGTLISYEVYGQGEPALVFIHGWSGDARYWRAQVPCFSKEHRVVVLDLAGHGHSGVTPRTRYTMASFGEDVRAVTEAACGGKVILVGHSMGGAVIAEAARLMPDRVIGLIGVDTLENVEYSLSPQGHLEMTAPLEKDFRSGSRKFVGDMFLPGADPGIREWVMSDVSAAPPAVAMSALNEYLAQYVTGEASGIFDKLRIPVITVNSDMWPINYEGNRRHMFSYETFVLKGADHFLMLDRPDDFNILLRKAVRALMDKKAR